MESPRKRSWDEQVEDNSMFFNFPWLEAAFVLSGVVLLFQLYPFAWSTLVSFAWYVFGFVDVRGWTWRSYAVVSAISIVVLAVAKAWQDNAWQRR